MLASLLMLGLAVLASAVPTVELFERDSPNLNEVYIKDLTFNGTGCPTKDSVQNSTSDDRQTLILKFDKFVAKVGPNVGPLDWRKFCQLLLELHYPQGVQYSILQTEYLGYVDIDAGVTAEQETIFYFSGESAQSTCNVSFTGPQNEDYHQTGSVPLDSVVWSPCGSQTALNIDSSLQIHQGSNPNARGQITTDVSDTHIQFIVGLKWRVC